VREDAEHSGPGRPNDAVRPAARAAPRLLDGAWIVAFVAYTNRQALATAVQLMGRAALLVA